MGQRWVWAAVLAYMLILQIASFGITTNPFSVPKAQAQIITTIPLGLNPLVVDVNEITNRIYVANAGSDNVSVINGLTDTEIDVDTSDPDIDRIAVGDAPGSVAVNPATNRIYVKNERAPSVSVIDGSTNQVIKTIALSGIGSGGVAVNPTTNRVYVGHEPRLSIIDGTTNTLLTTLCCFPNAVGVDVNPVTNRIYVALAGASNKVVVLDGSTNTVIANVGGLVQPHPLTVDPTTNRIYVGNRGGFDKISVIDGLTNTEIDLDSSDPDIDRIATEDPVDLAVDSTRKRLYVTHFDSKSLSVIDTLTNSVITTLSLSDSPLDIAVNSVTNKLYVTHHLAHKVSVIDGSAIGAVGDLEIVSVEPFQAVFGALTLVKEKATLVRVDVKNTFPTEKSTRVKLTFEPIPGLQIVKLEEVTLSLGSTTLYLPSDSFIFPEFSPFTASAEIDFENSILESDENNNSKERSLPVKETKELRTPYSRISECRQAPAFPEHCYGPLTDTQYLSARELGNKFTSSMFPLASGDFKAENSAFVIEGNPGRCHTDINFDGTPDICIGILNDAITAYEAATLFDPLADRAIAIVPSDYFTYHGLSGTTGISFCRAVCVFKGVLVSHDHPGSIPHELAHTFLIDHRFVSPAGYWVDERQAIPPDAQNMMCSGPCQDVSPPNEWIDNFTYQTLLDKLKANPNDPELLLLSGMVTTNGDIILREWFELPIGTVSDIPSGEFSYVALDDSGNLITTIPFAVEFEFNAGRVGLISSPLAPLAFKVPYPMETAKIQIKKGDEVLTEVIPHSKTLRDAIGAIPDRAFINNPEERRNTLLNKVVAFENMLELKNKKGALEKLNSDIKDKIQKWINEYSSQNPLELSKAKILELINSIDIRIRSQL